MQGFVIGYVNKRISDNLSLIASLILVAVAYLILVSSGITFSLLEYLFHLLPTDHDIYPSPTLFCAGSTGHGRDFHRHIDHQYNH